MTILKSFGVTAILAATIVAPVSAHEVRHHGPAHHMVRYQTPQVQQSTDNFRGRDPSRIGGEDPDLHPSAY
jgi:hypothetical protein